MDKTKHTVVSVKDCLIQGYPERHVTMSNGHRWCFRFANDRIHLMTGPGRVCDYPSEYRVARQRTVGFRSYTAAAVGV